MKNRLLCFGSLNIDYTYAVQDFVSSGETIKSNGLQKNIGGKGLNQAIACAKAGGNVFQAGKIGNDGLFLKKYLDENGVNTGMLNIGETPTGHAIIQVNEKGGNCIIIHGGANVEISDEYVNEVMEKFDSNDVLLIQNEINNLAYIVKKAKERQMTVVLNPSPVEGLELPFELIDIFILNEHEGEAIFGESDVDKLIEKMRLTYPNAKFVLTLGSEGAVYLDSKHRIFVPAEKVKAVDTTAAGDTFTGYFLNGIMNDKTPEDAMKLASKAASVTVSRNGAAESIPRYNEL